MIASVIELGEQPVREIMVPRMDIVATTEQSTVRQMLDQIIESGHSRIPIYEGHHRQHITGVIYARDFIEVSQGR